MPSAAFPLTAEYDPRWVAENALGENALCQSGCLARHLPLSTGMRILDLGCGRATSSIFPAREFGVEVWAVDATISPTDNRLRATTLDRTAKVFPLRDYVRDRPRGQAEDSIMRASDIDIQAPARTGLTVNATRAVSAR